MCRRRRGGSHEEAALGSPPAAHWKAITVVFPGRVVPAFFSSFFFSACPLSNSLGKRLSGNIMIIFRLPALLSLCDGPRGISNVNGLLIGFLPRQAPVLNDDARPGAASCSPFSLSLSFSLSVSAFSRVHFGPMLATIARVGIAHQDRRRRYHRATSQSRTQRLH